jgi:hypothetical protein
MKTIAMIAAAAAGLGLAGTAQAQDAGQPGLYANGGYTHYDFDDVTLGGVGARLGYRLHPNFAVEGEAAFGVKDDDIGPVNVELDNQVGVYGVGVLPVSPQLDLFGRVGWARVEASGAAGPFIAGGDEDGVAYGAGAQFMFTPDLGVRGDFTRLDGDDVEADAFSASAVVKF